MQIYDRVSLLVSEKRPAPGLHVYYSKAHLLLRIFAQEIGNMLEHFKYPSLIADIRRMLSQNPVISLRGASKTPSSIAIGSL